MSENTNFIGQPIFTRILKYVNKQEIDRIAYQYKTNCYTKKLMTYKYLIIMLYSVFEGQILNRYQDTWYNHLKLQRDFISSFSSYNSYNAFSRVLSTLLILLSLSGISNE